MAGWGDSGSQTGSRTASSGGFLCGFNIVGRLGPLHEAGHIVCDAPKPGGPLTTRQPAEYKWRSGYPTPL